MKNTDDFGLGRIEPKVMFTVPQAPDFQWLVGGCDLWYVVSECKIC